jgi:hypothetical protein
MRIVSAPCICTALLVLACGDSGGRDSESSAAATSLTGASSITVTTPSTLSDGSAGEAGESGSATASLTSGATGEGSSSGSDAPKFDLGDQTGGIDPTTGEAVGGCQKIDFLFVVDNSGSMSEEQEALAKSFPGFIASIQNTVKAEDYHIMVIDTDAGNAFLQSCFVICGFLPECEGYPCNMLPMAEGCDAALGTGLVKDPKDSECGVVGGKRYMVDGQPDLTGTFQCLAKVGTDGDGSERPMEAMITAVTDCNEGFLRKDALLVVTYITDEEDDGQSNGNPVGWNAGLVAAKYGAEKSIVVLGLIGDPDQPNPVCPEGQAEASPRLREFAESFTFGTWGSICSPDYAPFFDASVSVIDTACQQFEPPG